MMRRNLYYILRQDRERNHLPPKRRQVILQVIKNHSSSLTSLLQKNIMEAEKERR